mgnify:FL=1
MKIDNVNALYEGLKAQLTNAKAEVDKIKAERENLETNLDIERGKRGAARRAGDKDGADKADKEIKKIGGRVKSLIARLETKNAEVKRAEETINELVTQLSKDENIRAELDQALKVSYGKKSEKLLKNKEKALKKLETIQKISDLLKKEPHLAKKLETTIDAKKKVNKAKQKIEELKATKAPENADPATIKMFTDERSEKIRVANKELTDAQSEYYMNLGPIMTELEARGIALRDEHIDLVAKNGFEKETDKKGKDTYKFDKTEKAINKEITGYDKKLSRLQFDNKYIQGEIAVEAEGTAKTGTAEPAKEDEEKVGFFTRIKNRFNAWRESRKQKALPEGGAKQPTPISRTESEETPSRHDTYVATLKELDKDLVRRVVNEAKKDNHAKALEAQKAQKEAIEKAAKGESEQEGAEKEDTDRE